LLSTTSGYLCCFNVIWCIELYFSDVGLSTRKENIGEVILQIPLSLCPTPHYNVTNTGKIQPQGVHQVNSKKIKQFSTV